MTVLVLKLLFLPAKKRYCVLHRREDGTERIFPAANNIGTSSKRKLHRGSEFF